MQREQKRQRLLHLARFVSDILGEYEMSALQFAKLSGIPKSTVYTILSADHEPTAANMRKLAIALSQLTDKRITRDYLESLIDDQEGAMTDAISNSEEQEQSRAVDLMPSVEAQEHGAVEERGCNSVGRAPKNDGDESNDRKNCAKDLHR